MIDISDEDIDQIAHEHNARINNIQHHWHFDEPRRDALKTWTDIQACPGSGKTTLVAAKLLILAKKWTNRHKGICVLTHTNVARDEILSKIQTHPAGIALSSYPHFIGTIQEFVNRFLGLPYCRSSSLPISAINDELCVQSILRNLNRRTKLFLEKKHGANVSNLLLSFKDNDLVLSVPGFSKESKSPSYADLQRAKVNLLDSGFFFYSEMYAFAQALLCDNPSLVKILPARFPLVLVDEMQDTQMLQDELLNQIFGSENVQLQRFGDPDQAIFDSMGGGKPNESYNNRTDLPPITSTHRFGSDICDKIIGLSYSKIENLTSDRVPNSGNCPHTIFLFEDSTQEGVLEAFGKLVSQSDPDTTWKSVKAIGGVEGSAEVGQISKYWPDFDRSKSSSSPRPKRFIEIVHRCQSMRHGHVHSNFELLMQGVIDLFRLAGSQTKDISGKASYFTRWSLINWLRERDEYVDFRKLLSGWILARETTEEQWNRQTEELLSILDLGELTPDAAEYLKFGLDAGTADNRLVVANNMFKCADGLEIEVGTIHSVKGETHDATLVLETKLRKFDLEKILPHIVDVQLPVPAQTTYAEFMKKLYVATSRPRYLLCLAMRKSSIPNPEIAKLEQMGWKVVVLE